MYFIIGNVLLLLFLYKQILLPSIVDVLFLDAENTYTRPQPSLFRPFIPFSFLISVRSVALAASAATYTGCLGKNVFFSQFTATPPSPTSL